MPQSDRNSLWDALTGAGNLSGRSIQAAASSVNLSDLVRGSSLGGRLSELRDRSVLIATKDQFSTALALIELDGVARRVVLYPGDLSRAHASSVVATAEVDALVSDWDASETASLGVESVVTCGASLTVLDCARDGDGLTLPARERAHRLLEFGEMRIEARHHPARSAMAVKDQTEKGATFEDSAALFESLLVAAAHLQQALAAEGISAEEILKGFQRWHRGQRNR